MYNILSKINCPEDLKKLKQPDLPILAGEIREALFNRLTKAGGHFGPNFGVVEIEIAMHYVFNSPIDKFVFDVSHQSYTHKILTGRKNTYICDNMFSDDCGYSNPDESEHDLFKIGHTSTSISLATGLAKARDLKGGKEYIVALIGDGSLSGGEAMEGLNVAGSEIDGNLIILVNDNQQSISETHGGIYKNLKLLRDTKGQAENNLFTAFGLDYIYVENGNNIYEIISALKTAQKSSRPIVVHLNTTKGKGYLPAETNKEAWHWTLPFDRESGKIKQSVLKETYNDVAKSFILEKAKADKNFVVVTPNMPGSIRMSEEFRTALGEQYVDVGIAEEHAITMACGLAKGGTKPLVITNATFMQRGYDQILHDACINNSPITILLNQIGVAGHSDVGHLGIFAISSFCNIPNLVMLAPTCKNELLDMLNWATEQREHPVMILMPCNEVKNEKTENKFDLNTYSVIEKGEKVTVIALGDFFGIGKRTAKEIKHRFGFCPTLINPRFATGIDTKLLNSLKENHSVIITLENGIIDGGFGEKIATFYSDSNMKVLVKGLEKKFYTGFNPDELLEKLGISPSGICDELEKIII